MHGWTVYSSDNMGVSYMSCHFYPLGQADADDISARLLLFSPQTDTTSKHLRMDVMLCLSPTHSNTTVKFLTCLPTQTYLPNCVRFAVIVRAWLTHNACIVSPTTGVHNSPIDVCGHLQHSEEPNKDNHKDRELRPTLTKWKQSERVCVDRHKLTTLTTYYYNHTAIAIHTSGVLYLEFNGLFGTGYS